MDWQLDDQWNIPTILCQIFLVNKVILIIAIITGNINQQERCFVWKQVIIKPREETYEESSFTEETAF